LRALCPLWVQGMFCLLAATAYNPPQPLGGHND
jgi:hypothetical protein